MLAEDVTDMHKPLLVTDFLDRAQRHYGDDEAVVATTGERFTYDEFGDRADRISAALRLDHEYVGKIDPIRDEVPTTTFVTNDAGAVNRDWKDFETILAETEPEFKRPAIHDQLHIGDDRRPEGVMRTHRCETLHAYLVSIHQESDDAYL